jgi:hypothetical protein
MSDIEEISWLWNETNAYVEAFCESLPGETFMRARFEDMVSDARVAQSVADFAGAELSLRTISSMLGRVVNRQWTGGVQPYERWDESGKRQLRRLALNHKSDLLLGSSVAVSHVSQLTRGKSIVFNEDDADTARAFATLSYPFADAIVVPDVLRDRRTRKYHTHNSYHELAYLHPHRFVPSRTVLSALGAASGEPYFVVRLVAFKAYHDRHHRGLSPSVRDQLIGMLSRRGKVYVTMEAELPPDCSATSFWLRHTRYTRCLRMQACLLATARP